MQISQLNPGDKILAMDYSLLDRISPRACWKEAVAVSVRQLDLADIPYSILVDLKFDSSTRVHRSYFLEQLRAVNSGARLCSTVSVRSSISLQDILNSLED